MSKILSLSSLIRDIFGYFHVSIYVEYIFHINVTQTVLGISLFMPMNQNPLFVFYGVHPLKLHGYQHRDDILLPHWHFQSCILICKSQETYQTWLLVTKYDTRFSQWNLKYAYVTVEMVESSHIFNNICIEFFLKTGASVCCAWGAGCPTWHWSLGWSTICNLRKGLRLPSLINGDAHAWR